jgi:hypothetical protein
MEHSQTRGAPSLQKPSIGIDCAAQLRDVVAEHFAEAARLEKIALHVDDQERAMLRRERELVRFGGKVNGRGHLIGPLRGPLQSASRRCVTQGTCLPRDGGGRAIGGFGLPTAWIRAPLFFAAAAQGPGDYWRR